MEAFAESIDGIRYGRVLLALTLAVLAIQIIAFIVVRRRRTGDLRLVAIAGAAILALPVFGAVSVHAARVTMLGWRMTTDASAGATAASAGISGQLNAIPFLVTSTGVAVLLWVLGPAAALRARAAATGAPAFPRAALVSLGLGPAALGAIQWSIHLIKTFAQLAGLPPESKQALLLSALDVARLNFQLYAGISYVTIIGMAVLTVALTFADRRREASAPPGLRGRPGRLGLWASGGALIAAAALVVAARPMRAENDLPWPAPKPGPDLLLAEPTTPELLGPDPIERAPVVQVFADRLALDGATCDAPSLEEKLETLRSYYRLLHPGERFNGMVLVLAATGTSTAQLLSVLKAAHAAGYPKPMLGFTKDESIVRPTFGRVRRVRATGARMAVVDAFDEDDANDLLDGAEGIVVRPGDIHGYDDLARQAVTARATRKKLVVNLGK